MIRWRTDGRFAEMNAGERTWEGAVIAYPVYGICAASQDWENVYAEVWDAEKGEPRRVVVGVAAYGNSEGYHAGITVGLSPENQAAYDAYAKAKAERERAYREAMNEAKRLRWPEAGATVEVVRGRKLKLGTRVRVLWAGRTQFGLAARVEGGIWLSFENFVVIRTPGEVASLKANLAAAGLKEQPLHWEYLEMGKPGRLPEIQIEANA